MADTAVATNSGTPIFAPDGSVRQIPDAQIQDAISSGGKLAVQMKAPDGTTRYVPHDQVRDAQLSGGQVSPMQGTPEAPKPAEGFWHSLGSVFGLTPEAYQAAKQKAANMNPLQEALSSTAPPNPVDVAKSAGNAVKNEFQQGSQEGQESYDALQHGDIKGFIAHQIGQVGHAGAAVAAPVLGDNLSKAGEQFGEGNVKGGLGTTVGLVAPTVAHAVMPSGPTMLNALDKGTDVLADALTDPRKMATETIPRAAGRAVRKAFSPPEPARVVGQPPEIIPPSRQLGQAPTITPAPPDTSGSVPYTPPPVAATSRAERMGLLLPEAPPAAIPMPAVPTAPEPEGLFPAASTVVYDPVTGQSRTQFLTSIAEPGQGMTPQDSQLLNDPRGAFAKFAQEQDMGGLADPFDTHPASSLRKRMTPRAQQGGVTTMADQPTGDVQPRSLWNPPADFLGGESAALDDLGRRTVGELKTIANKRGIPFDGSMPNDELHTQLAHKIVEDMALTGDSALDEFAAAAAERTHSKLAGMPPQDATEPAQRTLGQPPEQTSAPQPQIPTDENTLDLLQQSLEQQAAKKAAASGNGSSRAIGQPPTSQNGPGLLANGQPVSSKVGGAKVLAGDIPLTGPVSPVAADITRLKAELKTATDPKEIADIQQALEHAQARMEGRPYTPPQQADAENLPASQPRTYQPPPYTRGQPPEVKAGAGMTPDNPIAVSSIPPGGSGIVKTSELNLDPKRFQYKANTDEAGTTNQFKDTETFNRPLAGVVSVWTDPADGKTYVVNGHHRVELANRTGEPTMLVQHLEASTPESARAQGALINIAEGRGTAVDAAKFIRDSGLTIEDLKNKGIPLSESKVSDGMALSKLDPSIFDRVATGQMPEQRGIAIGNATSDPAQQEAIVKLIDKQEAKGRKVTNDTVAELSRFVANSGNRTIEQGGLFGANQEIHSLALDKAELSAGIKQQLSKEKRVFGAVADQGKAQILSRVKDQNIQPGENAQISQQAAQAIELFDKLSVTKGPVNDILENVAKERASGYLKPEEARAKAYDAIRTELQKTLGSGEGGSGTGSQTRPGFPGPPK